MLNIALPKGRLGNDVCALFEKNGYVIENFQKEGRKLVITSEELGANFFLVKPSDVVVYVEEGVADMGVSGKDTLIESQADVYELLDLDIGKCRVVVAGPKNYEDNKGKILKVATKYTKITKDYYAKKNRDVEIIKLNGSIELAPILGLSDIIVDIVETGSTLKANNLVVLEEIMPISARLIANKSSCKFKSKAIDDVILKLKGDQRR